MSALYVFIQYLKEVNFWLYLGLAEIRLYRTRRELLLSTKKKEIRNESIPKLEAYETGLQVLYCVYTEATQAKNIWRAEAVTRRDF